MVHENGWTVHSLPIFESEMVNGRPRRESFKSVGVMSDVSSLSSRVAASMGEASVWSMLPDIGASLFLRDGNQTKKADIGT